MNKDDVITLEDLVKLASKYDKKNGQYPESKLEGKSVALFILGEHSGFSEWDDEVNNFYMENK